MTYRARLLSSVGKFSEIIWNSVKTDLAEFDEYQLDFNYVQSKAFGEKIDFLKTIFHSKIYLTNLEYSEIDPNSKMESLKDLKEIKEVEEFKLMNPDEENDIEAKTRNIS